jgi:NAD(P)-dependent dehydrogenase (short-subunit alcohol dehydrogenase family)
MKDLHGRVALVTGADEDVGKAVALALAARGARVVVMGRDERALAETVGEIACGGGKARHVAGDVRDPKHVAAAVERATEVFGGLDIVVGCAAETTGLELGAGFVPPVAIDVSARGITCNAVGSLTSPSPEPFASPSPSPEQIAARVVEVCLASGAPPPPVLRS